MLVGGELYYTEKEYCIIEQKKKKYETVFSRNLERL